VGVANTKFVAKLASTRAKPHGLIVVPTSRVLEFLHPLPVEALWGVGDKTAETLRRLGLRYVRDVSQAPVSMLRHALGEAAATHLHELSWGRDPRTVQGGGRVEKSIGTETTFDADVSDVDTLRRTMLSLSTRVGARLRQAGQAGRTVAIKVRLADFRTLSRSRTLSEPTDVARDIFAAAWALFEALGPSDRIRLLGVRVEGLGDRDGVPRQLSLDERAHGWRDAEVAVDAAAARFGSTVVRPASLLRRGDDSPAAGDADGPPVSLTPPTAPE
jgi:DNA polymerase-4